MEVPRHWRLKAERYRLVGDVCQNCDEKHFPAREVCPDCGAGPTNSHVAGGRIIEHTTRESAEPVNSSARITAPGYDGSLKDPNIREVVPHSLTLKSEALIGQDEIPVRNVGRSKEHIVYSAISLAAD